MKMKSSCVAGSTTTTALLLLLLLLASSCEATITCTQAVKFLDPCVPYLKGDKNQKPPLSCCVGAKSLVSAVKDVTDRRTTCNCIKAAAQNIKPNPENAKALPENCGITLPFAISPSLDCSRIG